MMPYEKPMSSNGTLHFVHDALRKKQRHQTAHYAPLMMPYKKTTSSNGTLHFVHDALRKKQRHQTAHYAPLMMPYEKKQRHQTAHYASFMMPYKKTTSSNGTSHFVHDALRNHTLFHLHKTISGFG
jgi:hypothetical protein